MKNSTLTVRIAILAIACLFTLPVLSQTTIDYEDFESGWGIWNDGGSDCYRGIYVPNNNYAIRLRDNSGVASSMTTDNLDLTGYSTIDFTFDFETISMENGEDFWVQFDNGGGWVTVATFTAGVDFQNNIAYMPTITLDDATYSFSATSRFRIRCDASNNTDFVNIDEVLIEGYSAAAPEIDVLGNGVSISDGDTTPNGADDTDFGSADVTTGSVVHTFTIDNQGTAALNLTGASPFITISGAHAGDFTVTATPANSISSGNSTTFDITFNPSATGLRTATLSIANDDSDENPYDFSIQGTGTTAAAEINITGNGVTIADGDTTPSAADDTDFGGADITSGSVVHTFTIENLGGSLNLNLSGASPYVAISGAHAADFSVTAIPNPIIGAGSNTTFNITFNPSAVGLRSATLTIANNDSDENPYDFSIQGTGTDSCGSYIGALPYTESFESGIGLWTQDTADNFDWTNQTNGTPSGTTGPDGAHDGSFYMFTEASGNYNNTANLFSPCIDLTGTTNPRFTVFFHMYGSEMGNLNIDLSTDGGVSFPINLVAYSGGVQNAHQSSWIPISIDLRPYIGQVVKLRIQGITGSGYRSDLAIDYVTVTDQPDPSLGPGGVTSDLAVWLKANDGVSLNDGDSVNLWQDQGRGSDAYTQDPGQAPTYHDNWNDNLNFNPVLEFDNSFATYTLDSDFSHDDNSGQFLTGDYGFHTQDIFIVLIPDDTPITNNFGFMDVFCSDAHLDQNATDATGIGFGYYTARVNGEIICYAHDTFNTGETPADGYAVAEIGTGSSYDNVGIINTRNNLADTQQELYYNGLDIETTQNDIAEYMNTNDSRFWIGRSEGWESSLNARVVEFISFSSRKDDADLTRERNRINSYLAVKYGITLGVNGISQDYVDSNGSVIWDQSANSGYNYDIAGIGRDDASDLLQKQSRSINNATDAIGRTQGLLTVALTDIYDTNNLNISDNPDTFTDRNFLMWGNNGTDLDLSDPAVSVNISAGITPALVTNVSFTGMQRHWKFVEVNGDVGTVMVSIPMDAIRNITPPGEYLMLISDTPTFDSTADHRVMFPDGNGNVETEYDFDGVKYVTFGYAPNTIVQRSIAFDGSQDYVDVGPKLNLDAQEFTLSAWIMREPGSENTVIVSKRDVAFTEGFELAIDPTGRPYMLWENGTSPQIIRSPVVVPVGEWHHIAVSYASTSGETILYLDGVVARTENLTMPIDTSQSFYIAASGTDSPSRFFMGHLDEIRVWNTTLTQDQIRFIMNQEIEENSNFVMGNSIPNTITKNDIGTVPWVDLAAYYNMSIYSFTSLTDFSGNNFVGRLRNLDTVDRQTAPLPYESQSDGAWTNANTWLNNAVQPLPNSLSIVDGVTPVGWNIVELNNDVTIDTYTNLGYERSVLSLKQFGGDLQINGDTAAGTGNGLTVTHYLKLDGTIDLEGESQLIQTLGSDLDPTSSGTLERDQQGTADTYTYNYWSSPVGVSNVTTNNNNYTLPDVMHDGALNINWLTSGYDGSNTTPVGIADYWIWKFANQLDDDYSSWQHVRSTGTLLPGEGFTMKGPGTGVILDDQNYVFNGKPYNGDINLPLNSGNDYLVGNPYASAIDAHQFILDNGPIISGNGATTGTLYFWEHWGGGSHILAEYQGGYATYNLSGGTPAAAMGTNDPDVGTGGVPTKLPGRYIPVNQGFFVVAEGDGTINFNNGQRIFMKEGAGNSIFMEANDENNDVTLGGKSHDQSRNYGPGQQAGEDRPQLRVGFNSVGFMRRQLLLTIDENATTGVDWGYDAQLNEDQTDDMYWIIANEKYVIQGSDDYSEVASYPLGIHANSSGMNTIVMDSFINNYNNLKVYVFDSELDVYHDLSEGGYEFYMDAGEELSRFSIVFSNDTLGIDDPELDTLDVHYSNELESIVLLNPTLKPITSIHMYDAIGKSIYSANAIPDSTYSEYEVSNLSTGTYILTINTEGGSFSKMVLVDE